MEQNQKKWPEMVLTPVGEIRNDITTPVLNAGESDIELQIQLEQAMEHHRQVENTYSDIIIFPQWAEVLEGIEDFSHILVLYWPHLIDPARRNLKQIHPMGLKDLPLQGIFATCSPVRPNPVLVSAVKLLERQDRVLRVKGLEAVDGSPVIDIKPYVHTYYGADDSTVADWMRQIGEAMGIRMNRGRVEKGGAV